MSTNVSELTEIESIGALDFEYTPPCESIAHTREVKAHGGDAYALVRMICPECGVTAGGYRCKPFVEWCSSGRLIRCNGPRGGCQSLYMAGPGTFVVIAYVDAR